MSASYLHYQLNGSKRSLLMICPMVLSIEWDYIYKTVWLVWVCLSDPRLLQVRAIKCFHTPSTLSSHSRSHPRLRGRPRYAVACASTYHTCRRWPCRQLHSWYCCALGNGENGEGDVVEGFCTLLWCGLAWCHGQLSVKEAVAAKREEWGEREMEATIVRKGARERLSYTWIYADLWAQNIGKPQRQTEGWNWRLMCKI